MLHALRARCVLGVLLAAGAVNTRAQPIAVPDARGVTLRLAAPASRIIAIAPHLTEIAFAAGAGDKVIAVSAYSDYPPAARGLPQVGDGARVDIERILMLKPDLVLAWKSGNQASDVARLERLGIKVWVSESSRLADIPALLQHVAVLAGDAASGVRAAREFERGMARVRARYRARTATRAPQRVFYEIWHQPLLTVNGRHIISDAIALCGGINVFAGLPVLTPSVSLEAVLAARPALVLGGGSAGGEAEFVQRWRTMPLAALRAIPARYIAPDSIQRQTPRIVDGVRHICAGLESSQASE